MKLLVHLYPGWWRRRYGAEALDILQGRPITARSLLDLLLGALDAWVNQDMPPSGADGTDVPILEGGLLIADNRRDLVSRWPFYASVALLGGECIACFLAGTIELGERGAMVGADPAEAAEQARFVIELYAIGALNLVTSTVFLFRRSGWSWWLMLGIQVGIFVAALIEGMLTDLGWFFFSTLPLLTLFLLVLFRIARTSLKPPDASWQGRTISS